MDMVEEGGGGGGFLDLLVRVMEFRLPNDTSTVCLSPVWYLQHDTAGLSSGSLCDGSDVQSSSRGAITSPSLLNSFFFFPLLLLLLFYPG